MSDSKNPPIDPQFTPALHLQCDLGADFSANQALTPVEFLTLVFRRYVPNPEFHLQNVDLSSADADHMTLTGSILLGERETDWAEVVDLAAAFAVEYEKGLSAAQVRVGRGMTGRRGAASRKKRANDRKEKINAFIRDLREHEPEKFERKQNVVIAVQYWAVGQGFEVTDKTIENDVYAALNKLFSR